jgi:xanthine dehydrogenase accessory factor
MASVSMEKGFYRYIAKSLSSPQPMVLATIIFRSGSAPREAGTTMAIFENNESVGTIGGGPLEAQVLQAAAKVIANRQSVCLKFSFNDRQSVQGGMICGGQLEVLVDYLEGNNHLPAALLGKIADTCEAGKPAWLLRSIRPDTMNETFVKTGLGVICEEDIDAGSLDMTGLDPDGLKQARYPDEAKLVTGSGGIRYLIQPVFPRERVIIAGAGHVGLKLAALCDRVGFATIIMDDRPDFASRDRFPESEIVIPQAFFENCFAGLSISRKDRIVIVTRGHEHDRSVLFQAIGSGAGYIGMIGSRRKRDAIYESLRKDGIGGEDLARVHCPIGLDIGAQTPAEIAVSIVAELIDLRNKQD